MAEPNRLDSPLALDDLFLYRISQLLGVAGSLVIRLCEGRFGITRREWRVLALLATDEGLLSSELAQRAQLDRARTSRAISSLVAKKLLSRQPRPGDRRQATLVLSPAGRELYDTLFPLVKDINQAVLAPLATAQRVQLDGWLTALQAQADALRGESALPKADRRRGGRIPRSLG